MPRPKHSLKPLWAHALLVDIWRCLRAADMSELEFKTMSDLEPITPPILDALYRFQQGRCALSGTPFVLPQEEELNTKMGLNSWRSTLVPAVRGNTPWIVQMDTNFELASSNILLIGYKWRELCRCSHNFENALSAVRGVRPLERYPSHYELTEIVMRGGNE